MCVDWGGYHTSLAVLCFVSVAVVCKWLSSVLQKFTVEETPKIFGKKIDVIEASGDPKILRGLYGVW